MEYISINKLDIANYIKNNKIMKLNDSSLNNAFFFSMSFESNNESSWHQIPKNISHIK